jgi:hypothetical protein
MFAFYFVIVFVAQVLRQRHVRIVRACAGTLRQSRQCSLLFEMPQQRQRPALLSAAQPNFSAWWFFVKRKANSTRHGLCIGH